jgi:hypothetical protein
MVDLFLGLQNEAADYGYPSIERSPDDWTAYFQKPDAKSFKGTAAFR